MKFPSKNMLAALLRQHILVLYETEEYLQAFLTNLKDIFGENIYFYGTKEAETSQFYFVIKRYNSGTFCGERWHYIYYEDSISREELLNHPVYCGGLMGGTGCVRELPLKYLLADSGCADTKTSSNEATECGLREDKEPVRGYKIINPDWTCRGKQYSCPGEFEEDIIPRLYNEGMHFCLRLSDCFHYYEEADSNHYVEVEAYGDVQYEVTEEELKKCEPFSGASKCCTNKLRIIRELSIEEIVDILIKENKDQNFNFGQGNKGFLNYGFANKGYRNDGKNNIGTFNRGVANAGCGNDGRNNIGTANIGEGNTGFGNDGIYCLGDFNKGDYSVGVFCSKPSFTIDLFNRPSNWSFYDWKNSIANQLLENIYRQAYKSYMNNIRYSGIVSNYFAEYYNLNFLTQENNKEIIDIVKYRQEGWNRLSEDEKQLIFDLPNFDADIFKECTGIDVNKKD